MDPLIVFFGFGVGVLVGLTGIGGGSLMTPLLVGALAYGLARARRRRERPQLAAQSA